MSGANDSKVGVLLNRGNGTFVLGAPIITPPGGGVMTLGHFYGNPNRLDLATRIAGSTNQILLFQSNGDGTFVAIQLVESSASTVGGMTTADVNKDGKDDLLAAGAGVVQVFLGNGDGTFQAPFSYITHVSGDQGGQIITGDLRHHGTLDLIVTNPATSDISVLLGNNDGTFQPSTNYVLNAGTATVVAADFDGDGNLDVIAGDHTPVVHVDPWGDDIELLKGNGNGTLQGTIDYATPGTEGIGIIASGDLNRDGAADLVTVGSQGNSVDVWIANGDGSFQPPVSYQVGSGPQGVSLADLDKDGTDIIVADAGDSDASHAIAVFLGQERRRNLCTRPVRRRLRRNNLRYLLYDLNGDGKMDLAAISRTIR